jgi:hypothetical protein
MKAEAQGHDLSVARNPAMRLTGTGLMPRLTGLRREKAGLRIPLLIWSKSGLFISCAALDDEVDVL